MSVISCTLDLCHSPFLDDRTIDVHIRRIRHKLETDPLDPQFILTVRGVGYKFGDKMP